MKIMDYYEISSLISGFKENDKFDDFLTHWLSNQEKISSFSTLFTFDEMGNEAPLEPLIGLVDHEKFFVRSIFSRKNVYFLNSDIWLEIMSSGRKNVPIDCVLSFDTQFGNYALKFIKDPNFRKTDIGSSFVNLLYFVYENNINPEFSFYLQENYANFISGHEKEIKNQLYALVKIVDLDKKAFLETGEVKLTYGADQLNQRVNELLSSYENKEILEYYNESENLQSMIAALILKASLLKKSKIEKPEKVKELVSFCHERISAILSRELYILSLWLMDAEIEFFHPINGGENLHNLPSRIHGMAWDFMLIRHVEKYCSKYDRNRYSLAYYSSFDRRMIEMSDLYKNRGCLYPPKQLSSRYFMIPELDLQSWFYKTIGDEFSHKIFNSDAWKKRDQNRPKPETITSLRRALEYDLIKSYGSKKI